MEKGEPVASYRRRNTALGRYYARAVAVVLVSVGLAGLGGGLSWEFPSGIYHVVVGLFFAYAGFFASDGETVRELVGGLGVLVLVVKVVTIPAPLLWGAPSHWGPIEVTCLVVGIASIVVARYLRGSSRHRERVR